MCLAIFGIDVNRLLQQPNRLIVTPALHFGDTHELERIGMARLARKNGFIDHRRLPDASVAV